MMKKLGQGLARAGIGLLVIAFLIFRTPDTDPAEMRAKYGGPAFAICRARQWPDGPSARRRPARCAGNRPAAWLQRRFAHVAAVGPAAEPDYRIIRFDQIGHGLTGPAPDGDYSTAAFVATVGQVANSLGLERFILGGNSMGGKIALAYAIAHPERLDGLILVDAGWRAATGDVGVAGISALPSPGCRWSTSWSRRSPRVRSSSRACPKASRTRRW